MLTAMKFSSLAAVACLSLLAAACSSPTVQAPNSVPAPTAAPPVAPTPTSSAAPTAVARPTQAASATVAPQSATTTSSTGATKLVIDQSVSQARYHAHEQLVGKTLPSEAVGTSKSVSGSLGVGLRWHGAGRSIHDQRRPQQTTE